ncbi:transposase [Piscirickettsia salmonis]|uniref:transposase n=1 Tax=Piscirickettsia salmonis TaxID=1238 RepID=UPI001E4CEEBF|nr:transposase [Piscirickettsia salmonis]
MRGKQFIAPMVVEGYCNNNVCQAYIDQCLIPCLSPGETVIMDNASFHKSKGVKEAIEDAGCHLLFLPPYSPDLNPIEHVWSPLKNRVRMKLDQDEINLEAALSQVMKSMSETVRWGLLQKIRISFRKVVYLHSLLQIKQLIQITY